MSKVLKSAVLAMVTSAALAGPASAGVISYVQNESLEVPKHNKFTFVLVRDNGMKQEVNLQTIGSGQESFAVWHKKYTFTKTEKRKYMIYVKGHKATAMWVPVGANCSSGPAGGFSNGPIPTN